VRESRLWRNERTLGVSDISPPPPPPPPPPAGGYGGTPAAGAPQYAEIGPRVVAFLIDLVAIPVVGWIALAIVAGILGAVSDALGGLVFLLGWLAIVGYTLFYVPYMEGTTGQTIGKKQQGIKTVSAETLAPVGFPMAFVRYLVNSFCFIFWLFPFFDTQKQTLGDKITKGITVPA
jgi:uncharacterized RDD family membrane protein YckC